MVPKKKKVSFPETGFIESMECLAVPTIPDGPGWSYEIKLDGFRLETVKGDAEATVYSP